MVNQELETSLFSSSSQAHRGETQFPWYAIRVRTTAEQRIGLSLQGKGYPVFAPTYVESRRYSDRIKTVQAALFPGYVFCRFDADRRLPVLQSAGVAHIVGIGMVPEPVPDAEIHAIQKIMASGLQAEPWPYLQTGDYVLIQFGGLTGVTGQLIQAKGKDRLVLSVHLLQRSVSVEIERAWVRPLTGPNCYGGAKQLVAHG